VGVGRGFKIYKEFLRAPFGSPITLGSKVSIMNITSEDKTANTNEIAPVTTASHDIIMSEKKVSNAADATLHLESLPTDVIRTAKWDDLRADAMIAEEAERNLSIRESLRLYPKAVLWSLGISLVIIMEGYDLGSKSLGRVGYGKITKLITVVLGNLIGVPKYREQYGYWTGEENGYQLTPAWQTAVGQASTIGCFL
jgi:SP family general alpha glucoside:H+ symporter-like MFS transporter